MCNTTANIGCLSMSSLLFMREKGKFEARKYTKSFSSETLHSLALCDVCAAGQFVQLRYAPLYV